MWKCTYCDTPNSEFITKCEVCGQLHQSESRETAATSLPPVVKPIPGSMHGHSDVKIYNALVWRQWLFANMIACSLMAFFNNASSVFIPVVTWGCVLGFSQWLVMRRYFPNIGKWGVMTSISFIGGFYAVVNMGQLPLWFSFSILGFMVGIAQWLVVRHLDSNSGLWIFTSALSWGISVLLISIFPTTGGAWWQFIIIGFTYGAISGWALLSIFRIKFI